MLHFHISLNIQRDLYQSKVQLLCFPFLPVLIITFLLLGIIHVQNDRVDIVEIGQAEGKMQIRVFSFASVGSA